MPKKISTRLMSAAALLVSITASLVASAQSQTINASIDVTQQGPPISKYIYGQFLEHLGGLVNDGMWAEMLDDRKFYYPIVANPPIDPTSSGFGRSKRRHWLPIGSEANIALDRQHAYTGEHSPAIKMDRVEARGFAQSGLAVRNNRSYSGRIVLSGKADSIVKVSLVWGSGATDRQTVTIKSLKEPFSKYPIRFYAKASSDDARLEIVAMGSGSVHVGAISLMPSDNIKGFRAEVIAALKQLNSGVYRWPGGNFVSSHEWRDAVGDIDRRPPIMDPVWNAVQPNDVGTDEFMTLCELLGVEAYITVNAGFGDAWSAAQLVEYVNGAANTPMGMQRAVNGRSKPYAVKLWGIGNEPWGDWQMGFIPVSQYVLKHNLFAKAMRKVDPSIKLIAAGAMPDALTGSKQAKRLNGQIIADYLSPGDWSGNLLLHSLDNMDYLSEHYYARSNERFDAVKGEKVDTGPQSLVEWSRAPANLVRAKYEHYQEYLKRIPALKAKPVPISLDEWAFTGSPFNSYKVVPAYAWAFHEMFRYSDLYQIGGFTFATTMISAGRTDAVLSPTGLLFKMYGNYFGTVPVSVSGNSPQPKTLYPPGGDQPKVNPGSDTYPLDVSAALTEDRKALTFAIVNPSDSEQRLRLQIQGINLATHGRAWRLAPSSNDASITIGKKPEVEIEAVAVNALPENMLVPPFSVSIYRFSIK